MGRNAAIRKYDPHPEGQPMGLFVSREGRLPVVLELLRSPWIKRASELEASIGTAACKRLDKPVEVAWDGAKRAPTRFVVHGTTYTVDAVVQSWNVEAGWWIPERHVSRRCYRVLARGGVYDLAYDRLGERWLLAGVVD